MTTEQVERDQAQREHFLGHKDSDIIRCQCGWQGTQAEYFKDINYRTERASCPTCHCQTTRYLRPKELKVEALLKRHPIYTADSGFAEKVKPQLMRLNDDALFWIETIINTTGRLQA